MVTWNLSATIEPDGLTLDTHIRLGLKPYYTNLVSKLPYINRCMMTVWSSTLNTVLGMSGEWKKLAASLSSLANAARKSSHNWLLQIIGGRGGGNWNSQFQWHHHPRSVGCSVATSLYAQNSVSITPFLSFAKLELDWLWIKFLFRDHSTTFMNFLLRSIAGQDPLFLLLLDTAAPTHKRTHTSPTNNGSLNLILSNELLPNSMCARLLG